MGVVLSTYETISLAVTEFFKVLNGFNAVLARVSVSPGLPIPDPTRSFWISPETDFPTLPEDSPSHFDVVILGSGITGASVARTLLHHHASRPLTVLMLEARDVCSGATGRNGGHIKAGLYSEYGALKAKYGIEAAKKIIIFRLASLDETRRVAEKEGITGVTACRTVESVDVFLDKQSFEKNSVKFELWRQDMPRESQGFQLHHSDEAIQKFKLSSHCVGAISGPAGAMNAYRFVTSILRRLLNDHPSRFFLATKTPCISISAPTADTPHYTIMTPKRNFTTSHVVHATNAFAPNLLPSLLTKVVTFRGTMSAQRPGQSFPHDESRSWFFVHGDGLDYISRLPGPRGELMFGGGFVHAGNGGMDEVGNTDDGNYDARIASHLSGALPVLFGEENWGSEDQPTPEETNDGWGRGRVKALWTGIMGLSADGLPWVGRIPSQLTNRGAPPLSSTPTFQGSPITSPPGEFIAAGYSGDGMSHAYLCGKAVALSVLGKEEEASVSGWLPEQFRIGVDRLKKAKVEDLSRDWN